MNLPASRPAAPVPHDNSPRTEPLSGLVAENGFCVLRVKVRGHRDLVTVVGHAPLISAGVFIQASGGWINDRTHGAQFRTTFLKAAFPDADLPWGGDCVDHPGRSSLPSPG